MTRKFFLLLFAVFSAFLVSAQEKVEADSSAHHKKVSLVGIPKVSYNRSSGLGLGAAGMILFKLDKSITIPKSAIMVSGSYTTENSWYAMGAVQLYLLEDHLRITGGGGYMDFHFQTFYDTDGTSDIEIPYVNSGNFLFLNPLVRIYHRFYLGPTISMLHTKVDFDLPDGSVETRTYNSNSLGLAENFDTRSNVYYPTSGFYGILNISTNPRWFNNDSVYSRLLFNLNYYHSFNKNKTMILASRAAAKVSFGDVPFTGENVIGGKDIRGYTKGNYRGKQAYAIQTEFRWQFYKRLGMVGFFGLALEIDDNVSPVLPGLGAGFRFRILPKDQLNIGIDVAVGHDDWGIYFRIGEAF